MPLIDLETDVSVPQAATAANATPDDSISSSQGPIADSVAMTTLQESTSGGKSASASEAASR